MLLFGRHPNRVLSSLVLIQSCNRPQSPVIPVFPKIHIPKLGYVGNYDFCGGLYQGCALRKIEGCPVLWTCKIYGAQHMICMKNLRFSIHPRAKVGRQGPPGSARAQPWTLQAEFRNVCVKWCFIIIRSHGANTFCPASVVSLSTLLVSVTISVFYGAGLLALRPTPNLKDQGVTLCQVSTLRPFQHGWPYQEYKTPADIEVVETNKLPHHDKVVLGQNMMFIYLIQFIL